MRQRCSQSAWKSYAHTATNQGGRPGTSSLLLRGLSGDARARPLPRGRGQPATAGQTTTTTKRTVAKTRRGTRTPQHKPFST